MDGNAYEPLQTTPLKSATSLVRVQCEAYDCGALLEIEIPSGPNWQSPLIVRCGNCQRLLEVWLNHGNEAVTSKTKILSSKSIPPPSIKRQSIDSKSTLDFQIKSSDAFHLGARSHHQLVKPPPLSRSNRSSIRSLSLPCITSMSHPLSDILPQDTPSSRAVISGGHSPRSSILPTSTQGVTNRIRKDRRNRHPSPYNRFMSREVKRIKAENPDVDHRRAFRMAASNWARSPTSCQRIYIESGLNQSCNDRQSLSSVGESNDAPSSTEKVLGDDQDCIHMWKGDSVAPPEAFDSFGALNDS